MCVHKLKCDTATQGVNPIVESFSPRVKYLGEGRSSGLATKQRKKNNSSVTNNEIGKFLVILTIMNIL